jgi:TorA-specific chaperone
MSQTTEEYVLEGTEQRLQEGAEAASANQDDINLSELMRGRAQTYGMLARLYRVEVDLETLRELQRMKFPQSTGVTRINEGLYQIYSYLKGAWEDSVTELAIDYVNTFIGHGVNGYSAAYPFESVYTSERRLLMQEARAEVLEVLRGEGLKRGNSTEGEDHIALELELMQRYSLKCANALENGEDDEAVTLVQKMYDFLENHLINWLPMLNADMQQYAKTSFYQGLGGLSLGFVEYDETILRELLDSVQ